MMGRLSLVFFAIFLARALGEITVWRSVQYIYDKSPKLRIRGSGFDVPAHDIRLDIGLLGQPSLVVDKDYSIANHPDGDGLILTLVENRRWLADLSGRTPPVAMVLSSVHFAANPEQNLLAEPVIVAQVLNTPSVKPNANLLYQSASNELRIDGAGFMGSKGVNFYFMPPLTKEVAYEDVTPYPLKNDQIVLRLRHGYRWRDDAGPLRVIGIDTGGGPVRINGDVGVQVAQVEENPDLHGITVESSASEQLLYADEPRLMIRGTGFNPAGNVLRFANGLLGQGINYTSMTKSETTIALTLAPKSYWRTPFEALPGTLTLQAVNGGLGFVAVGPLNSGKGRQVATIFERPQIHPSDTKLFRTHSARFHISGTGFPLPPSPFKPSLKFSPPLREGEDYSLTVVSRHDLEITLLDGRAWSAQRGVLYVTAVNTRGDEAGWITFPGSGIQVADIYEDFDPGNSGGVEVIPMGVKVYQSALQREILLYGKGFREGMSFTFEPPLQRGFDYDLEIQSQNKAVMKLKTGRKWRSNAGFLFAKSVVVDGKEYPLAGTEGIRVAVVLADPVLTAMINTYHESQSKLVVVSGYGFTNAADTKIRLSPTSNGAFMIRSVSDDAIQLLLKPNQAWLPSYMSLNDEDPSKKTPLQVTSIDTGAGEIVFPVPVTIGYLVKDRKGVVCDDSCEFAFDGVCDDGTDPNDQYYQNADNGVEVADGDPDHGYGGGVVHDDDHVLNVNKEVSPCVEGTDCTDCGGVDAVIDYSKPLPVDSGYVTCTNTCIYPRDGVCDDIRGTKYCELGTDCQDCGPVGADNFTRVDAEGGWEDHGENPWTFHDTNFLDQAKGLEYNRHKVKTNTKQNSAGPWTTFHVALGGLVCTAAVVFAVAALYLLRRGSKGQSEASTKALNPELDQSVILSLVRANPLQSQSSSEPII